jgi:hypothetical protein
MWLTPDRYLIDTGQYRPSSEMATCGNITVTCPISRAQGWHDSKTAALGALIC